MERDQDWQEQGGGQQTTEGGPTGVDPDELDAPNESAPGHGDEENDFPPDDAAA